MPESDFDQFFSWLITGINKGTDVRVAYIRHVPHSNDMNHFCLSFLNKTNFLHFDPNRATCNNNYKSNFDQTLINLIDKIV